MKYNHLGLYYKTIKSSLTLLKSILCLLEGAFFQNGRQISMNILFLVQMFLFLQFSFSLMKYNHLGLYYKKIKSS